MQWCTYCSKEACEASKDVNEGQIELSDTSHKGQTPLPTSALYILWPRRRRSTKICSSAWNGSTWQLQYSSSIRHYSYIFLQNFTKCGCMSTDSYKRYKTPGREKKDKYAFKFLLWSTTKSPVAGVETAAMGRKVHHAEHTNKNNWRANVEAVLQQLGALRQSSLIHHNSVNLDSQFAGWHTHQNIWIRSTYKLQFRIWVSSTYNKHEGIWPFPIL